MSVTSFVRLIRRLDEYEAWRRAVFIRDRFTCQQCGKRNGRKKVIETHHLTSLALIVREHKINSIEAALDCPILWEISNGQTLCKTCHQLTDSYPKQLIKKKSNGKRKTFS